MTIAENRAKGSPTKSFFVDMLTRDIDLSDAILDLLDNCIDGVVRKKNTLEEQNSKKYYEGYHASISIKSTSFCIEDNCGGIPRDVATQYAFRMGRASDEEDSKLATVGIYGIGMKRAIFKIGQSAEVLTRNDNQLYKVTIPKTWKTDNEWDFPLEDLPHESALLNGGTKITITDLCPDIAVKWNTSNKIKQYSDDLIKAIQQSYSFIIEKGFSIKFNEVNIKPLPINLLLANTSKGIQPYFYEETFDDVHVQLAVGFYAPMPSVEEMDQETEGKRASKEAGWTIVCNDRVILYNDKSHLTGWGVSGIPQYHTQFIGIRGIVFFESKKPQNLPMTTTKRGIDASSRLYAVVKDRMCEGLKLFINYTNKWKGQNEHEREYSQKTKSVSVTELIQNPQERKLLHLTKKKNSLISKPVLPTPPNDKPYRQIRYTKPLNEIQELMEYFFQEHNEKEIAPSKVGEKAFEEMLEKIHNQKKE